LVFFVDLKIDRGPSNKSADCGRVVGRGSFVFFVTLAGLPDRSKRQSHGGAEEQENAKFLLVAMPR